MSWTSSGPARVRALNRAELAVIGFCALGAGNVWIRLGGGNVVTPPNPGAFVFGFVLVVAAGVICYMAPGRPAALPGALVCSTAILVQTLVEPAVLPPIALVYAGGVLLALVPVLRSRRVAWALLAAGTLTAVATIAHQWVWGSAPIDVFTEVQGSTQALLHGHNPYAPVYPILIDSFGPHQVFGSGSLNYGPMVVLLSIPSRLLGDVRLTVAALNVLILAAVLVWARRASGGRRFDPTVAALFAASPFVPFMVLTEWTDTFCVAGFAWWLVLRDRHRNWAVVALTVGLASKPTMLAVMVPILVWSAPARSELIRAAAGTVAIMAPFAIWTGVPQFVYDTVGIYTDLPGRHDAANLNGLVHLVGSSPLPATVLFAGVALAVVVFSLRRCRDYGDLLAGGAGVLIFACLFAKQAYFNYYFSAAIALLFIVGGRDLMPSGSLDLPALLRRVLPARLGRWPATADARSR